MSARIIVIGTLLLLSTPAVAIDRYQAGVEYLRTLDTRKSQAEVREAGGLAEGGVSRYNADIDYRKMAVITEEAQRRGHRIVWINPPQRRPRREAPAD